MTSRFVLALWLAATAAFSAASADAGADTCDGAAAEKIDVNLLQHQLAMDSSLTKEVAAKSNLVVPSFKVDLDQDPAIRWISVLDYYDSVGLMVAMVEQQDNLPRMSDEDILKWFEAVKPQVPDELLAEAAGMCAHVKKLHPTANCTVEETIVNSFYYEQNYPTFCSGVLAAMPNGTVIHGRNLDYPMKLQWKGLTVGWPELTVDVTFFRAGKPLFESVTWPMQLGVHTGMRFDGWTIEQNTRDGNALEYNLAAIQEGGLGGSLVLRMMMQEIPDYDTAIERLWNTRWAAPQYYIMSGKAPWQGGVLSVDRMGLHLPSSPPIMKLGASGGDQVWHIVQTNDDLNKAPEDDRRPGAELQLQNTPQNSVSPTWMMNEMRSSTLFNEGTAFTWVASPALSYHEIALPDDTIDIVKYTALHIGLAE